jgi:integrase
MKAKISKTTVDRLPRGKLLVDTEIRGFVARRLPNGTVTYGMRYRDKATHQRRWLGLGVHGEITPDEARTEAEKRRGEIAERRDPLQEKQQQRAAGGNTVNAVLDAFVQRHVRKNLRAAQEVERVFDKYVRPAIGAKCIYELRRRDVVEMLDAVEDDGDAPVMADRVLAHTHKAFNWWATRDDSFNSPIVKGMARTKPAERARKRYLTDDELCDVWRALDTAPAPACYPAYVRVLLLTTQRRDEVARMSWPEIEGGTWVIPAERYKTGVENVVPLMEAVLQLLGNPPKTGFVFSSTDGELPFSGFSKAKRALDKAIGELRKREKRKPIPHWTLHDLRRTARSLMSRAGVSADIAERVLGHKIGGVRGVYDRHEYVAEKRDALQRLGALVERILNPPAGPKSETRSSRGLHPPSAVAEGGDRQARSQRSA